MYDHPELARILKSDLDLNATPASFEERLFVQMLVLHLNTAFKARKEGMGFEDDQVSYDIRQFFARPIPRSVWEHSKSYQSPDFVDFVENALERPLRWNF